MLVINLNTFTAMPSIRPRIDPSEYARQKAEKAEKAFLRREEIKRKQRGEVVEEEVKGGDDNDYQQQYDQQQNNQQQHQQQQQQQQYNDQHQPQHKNNSNSTASHAASFLQAPQNPEGYEFSPAFFEKKRQQFGGDEEFDRPSSCLALNANGAEGCVGSSDHALYTFQLSSGSGLRRLYSKFGGHTDWVSCVTYLSDGRVLSGGMDGKLCLWSRGGGAAATAEDLIGEQGSISQVTRVPQSNNVTASSGYDGSICLWDLSRHTAKLRKITNERKQLPPILKFAMSSDGKQLLSGTNNGLVSLWDLEGERVVKGERNERAKRVGIKKFFPS